MRRVASLIRDGIAKHNCCGAFGRYWQIVLQKSENAGWQVSRQKTKQATIADRCGVRLVTEVACEFITWR
jgi:hypothetical protein